MFRRRSAHARTGPGRSVARGTSLWPVEGIVVVALGLAPVLAVVVDAEARIRGRTDPRWRRLRSIVHSVLTCLVVALLGGIALLVLVLWIFRPIGGP
jgi:hypothetical protein